jgi:carbon monoxide dehydrogenase subunit G
MKLSGEYTLPAPPEKVWALLTDPQRLAKLLPGCERLEPDGPDRFKAAIKFGLAAISGKYTGTVEFLEKKPHTSMLMKIAGKGLPGFVDGSGRIEMAGLKNGQTDLRYTGDAQVGGMIASVGQRMIEGAAKKIVDQFFAGVAEELKKG